MKRSHSGASHKRENEKKNAAVELLSARRREEASDQPLHLSYARIARLVHVHSPQTIWNWDHQDMSERARELRAQSHAWNRLLQPQAELELGGFAFYHAIHGFKVDTANVCLYSLNRFHVELVPDWVSDWLVRAHLCWHDLKYSNRAEWTEGTIALVAAKISEIRSLHLPPHHLYAIDKMYINDQATAARGIGPSGLFGTSLPSLTPLFLSHPLCSRHFRIQHPPRARHVDIQYTTLVADGTLGKLYVETKRKDVTVTNTPNMHVCVVPESEKGRGAGGKHSFDFFNYMVEDGQFVSDDHSAPSSQLPQLCPPPEITHMHPLHFSTFFSIFHFLIRFSVVLDREGDEGSPSDGAAHQ